MISSRPVLMKSWSVLGSTPGCINLINKSVASASTSVLLLMSSATSTTTSATVNELSSASHSGTKFFLFILLTCLLFN